MTMTQSFFATPKALTLVCLLVLTALLAGCAPLVIGGAAATTAVVVTDRRTTGEQVEDKAIEMKISQETGRAFDDRPDVRVTSVSYAGKVLLYGDVPNEADKNQAATLARGVENVKEVINRIRIGDVTPLGVRSNDTWITTKVMANLIEAKEVPTRTIVVTTERGVVYLMGKVTETEGRMAARVAANVQGVNEVVKLFTIVPRESVVRQEQSSTTGSRSSTTKNSMESNTSNSSNPDVQAMPVQ